jgi:hypothetical protein
MRCTRFLTGEGQFFGVICVWNYECSLRRVLLSGPLNGPKIVLEKCYEDHLAKFKKDRAK